MHALEFTAKDHDDTIPLSATARLPTGKAVRVVLLFDAEEDTAPERPADGPIAQLMQNPLVIPGFKPLSRDEAHER
jgi:hypothetical protein